MHLSSRILGRASLSALFILLLAIAIAFTPTNTTRADAPPPPTPGPSSLPPGTPARGMIYAGLESANPCTSGYRLVGTNLCTHGPDPSPVGVDVSKNVAPDSPSLIPSGPSGIICDGNGVTGSRVQVLYVHGSDVASRLGLYLASIRSWTAGADSIYNESANETGGGRHVHFVTDSTCNVSVVDVQVSPAGKFSLDSMVSALKAKGYTRTDRKYLSFVDTNLYCGIATIWGDDQPGAANKNNIGPSYSRVDNGCWGSLNGPRLAAHELMHNLGGVQLSAPHTTHGWHCTDGYDRMCYHDSPTAPPMTFPCSNPARDRLFDCNHNDYYSTNPPAGSYLATHWNAANSRFLLVGAPPAPPGAGIYQDKNLVVKYNGTWATISNAHASGGTYHRSQVTGSQASLTFIGKQVTLKYSKARNQGKAQVYIDNVPVDTIDQYSWTSAFQLSKTYGGLALGPHTVRIRVSGLKNQAATAYWITVDAFVVI